MVQASASGKIILFGEHAVVYGRPAIAVPVTQVRATATITSAQPGSGLTLHLPDIGEQMAGDGAGHDATAGARRQPCSQPAWVEPAPGLVDHAQVHESRGQWDGQRRGCGHGDSAGDGGNSGRPLTPAQVSALVFESETLFHGQASGIDNTVIAYEQPVWFVRGQAPQPFRIARRLRS